MTTTFTTADQSVSAFPQDIITAALYEIGVLAQGEVLSPGDASWGLQKLQRLIDGINAQRQLIFSVEFDVYTLPILTPLGNGDFPPVTIGPADLVPTPNFTIANRPVRLESAVYILPGGTSNIDVRMNVRDAQWWAAQTIKNLTSSISTDVYYEPTYPAGSLFFWPVSTVANQVRLEWWTGLAQAIGLTTKLTYPQGYWDYITLSLAMNIAPSYTRPIGPDLQRQYVQAKAAITENNAQAPMIRTNSGMPGSSPRGRTDDNFLNGKPW